MPAPSSQSALRRCLALAVWLALVLPVAQVYAAWHGYKHVAASEHGDDAGGLRSGPCDLCLGASALAHGATSSAGSPCSGIDAGTARVVVRPAVESPASRPAPYSSRAPPSLQR